MNDCEEFLQRVESFATNYPDAWDDLPVWEGPCPPMRDPAQLRAQKQRELEWDQAQERMTRDEFDRNHKMAKVLSDLTDGLVEVGSDPNTRCGDDTDAKGHLYHGRVPDDDEELSITLDDRLDESLLEQIISELTRVSEWYAERARCLSSIECLC